MTTVTTETTTNTMTEQAIRGYFDRLRRKDAWESSLSDDMVFTSYTSPMKQIHGREGYLQATKRFYSMIRSVELRELLVDGERACALTRYELKPPNGGPPFASDVAEILTARNGKIEALAIYFDTAPYPR